MKKKFISVAALVSALLGCSERVQGKEPVTPSPGKTGATVSTKALSIPSQNELERWRQSALNSSYHHFGFQLMVEWFRTREQQNLVLSPLSAAIALSMVLQGAKAETRQAMLQTLALQGVTTEEIRRMNLILRKGLAHAPTGVELASANAIFGKKGLTYNPVFLQVNQDYFGANTELLDFAAAQAPTRINDWVKGQTRGKITQVIQKIEPLTLMLLLNALYFKGQWREPFDANLNETRNFYLANKSTKRVEMMSHSGTYAYLRDSEQQLQAVALPYGPDEQVKMLLFLPDPESTLNILVNTLTPANWKRWQTDFKKQAGDVVIPKFKLNGEAVLNDTLRILGMGVAFESGNANFTDLINDPTAYISQVKQNTFLEVNEHGSEAAAATTVVVKTRSSPARPPGEPFHFVAERPFLAVIYDERLQSVLFMATVNDP